MTIDWLGLCRGCVADIEAILEQLPTRAEREPVLRAGMGGDDTTAIDAAAEDAVVARLAALDADFMLVSEELGERSFGSGGPLRIVVDPIDGSVNAKRGIPFFSLSLAVADGPAMGDVSFGFVHDFGAGEEWVAERGCGVRLNGRPLTGPAAEGSDRDPLLRGDNDRLHRRAGSRRPWRRAAAARDGIPGAVSVPSRGRKGRRGLLAQGGAVDRHRRGAAARPRAGIRDRAVRGSAIRVGAPRSQGALSRRRSRHARAVPDAGRGAPATLKGAAFAAPSCMLREVERPLDMPSSLPPVCGWTGPGSRPLRSRARCPVPWLPQLAAAAVRSNAGACFSFLAPTPRMPSARMMKPMPLSSRAIPTTSPNRAICSAM